MTHRVVVTDQWGTTVKRRDSRRDLESKFTERRQIEIQLGINPTVLPDGHPEVFPPDRTDIDTITAQWRDHIRSVQNVSHSYLLETFISYHSLPNLPPRSLDRALRQFITSAKAMYNELHVLMTLVLRRFPRTCAPNDLNLSETTLSILLGELRRYICVVSEPSVRSLICRIGEEVVDCAGARAIPREVIPQLKERVLDATYYHINDDLAWEVLDHVTFNIRETMRQVMHWEIERSSLDEVAFPERSEVVSPTRPGNLRSRVADRLQKQHQVDLTLFPTELSRYIECCIHGARWKYSYDVYRLIQEGAVLPDRTATVDDQVTKLIRQLPPTYKPHHPDVRQPAPTHQYAAMYARQHYSGYLTNNPSSNIFEHFPPELIHKILGYVFNTETVIEPPSGERDSRRWRQRPSASDKTYLSLCSTSRRVHHFAQVPYMSRITMRIVLENHTNSHELAFIRESDGPRLDPADRIKPIRGPFFSSIRTLKLTFPVIDEPPRTPIVNIFPLLDSLTGLKTVQLFLPLFFSCFMWSMNGQIEGWVMQLLARIRSGVNLAINPSPNAAEFDATDGWHGVHDDYDYRIFWSWAEVTRQALAVERKTAGQQEQARRAGNPLALSPDAYPSEWRNATVQVQQIYLKGQGYSEDAERLGACRRPRKF